jgi:hypothetical protein
MFLETQDLLRIEVSAFICVCVWEGGGASI